MNKSLITFAIVFFLPGLAIAEAPAQAATCVACHGEKGVSSNAEWPNIAGQKKTYMIRQITAFRDGERENALMAPMLANFSDGDIEVLAEYYSRQSPGRAAGGDSSLVARGHNARAYCVSCHGMTGVTANDEWPNLAGQQAKYLENQLNAFKSGARVNGVMQNVLKNISEEEFAALAAYFSQLKP